MEATLATAAKLYAVVVFVSHSVIATTKDDEVLDKGAVAIE